MSANQQDCKARDDRTELCGDGFGLSYITFLGFSRFEVGDGARTEFWHDLWFGDTVLKEAFPVLFGIARAKDTFVANNLELLGGSN
jgi:hypothetical protein